MEKSWSERVRTVKGKDTKRSEFCTSTTRRIAWHPSFSRDDLETQMPSGRGSTSTALKKANITSAQVTSPSWTHEFWTACRLPAIAVSMFIVTNGFDVHIPYVPPGGQLFQTVSKKTSKKLVTGQYFVFFGGTERESHLLTGPPPVVAAVEEKAVAR